jgi:CMP-N,N'-diacetyllegionaminic acid synthase
MTKIIAIIPCRAGSVRLPHKNRKLLNGKPLFTYSVETALECEFIDEIIISTNDEKIIEYYDEHYLIEPRVLLVMRPDFLDTPDTPMWAVVEHCGRNEPADTITILLQPTSPLRTEIDIRNAWRLFELYQNELGVISVYWEYPLHDMVINGAIYIHYLQTILNSHSFIHSGQVIYIMPKERSIDIDTREDFRECERLLHQSS